MTAAEEIAREALAATPVIDGHNDLPMALRDQTGYSVEGLDGLMPQFHTDLVRLRQGGVGAQFWSVYVSSKLPEPEAAVATMEQIDAVYRMVQRYPDQMKLAFTAADVETSFREGRLASLLGIEGGHSIARSLGLLRMYARLGVRYMTLTHNDNTAWADSATDVPAADGLTEEGRAIVAEMNRLGILVDLSHTADATMRDALAVSTAPVIYSHSSTRALCTHPRNVPDDVLALLPGNGGVIQVSFVPPFISEESAAWFAARGAARAAHGIVAGGEYWTRAPFAQETAAEAQAANAAGFVLTSPAYEQWLAENPAPRVTVAQVADHIEHARDVAGIDHIGVGGDYDGIDLLPEGLEDVTGYPLIFTELAARGWSGEDLRKVSGGNMVRVLRDAEDVATDGPRNAPEL